MTLLKINKNIQLWAIMILVLRRFQFELPRRCIAFGQFGNWFSTLGQNFFNISLAFQIGKPVKIVGNDVVISARFACHNYNTFVV
jgi:hypothetical protein